MQNTIMGYHYTKDRNELEAFIAHLNIIYATIETALDTVEETSRCFQDYEPLEPSFCTKAIEDLKVLCSAINDCIACFDKSNVVLPIAMIATRVTLCIDLHDANKCSEDAILYLVSYRSVGDSTKIEDLQLRRQVQQRLGKVIRAVQEILIAKNGHLDRVRFDHKKLTGD